MITDIFTLTFVQYAFLAGTVTAVLTGLLGPMVVSSRQSVASDMFAHIALAGVGMAAVFGFLPLVGAFAVLIFGAVLLWWVVVREKYATDALSMVFLSGGLAIALAFIHTARNQAVSFDTYLFGSILTVTSTELKMMILLAIGVITTLAVFWYPMLSVVQSPPYRVPYSSKPQLMQLLFFILVALTVLVELKTIGGLLIGALLVIPVLIARNFAATFKSLTVLSVIFGIACMHIGLLVALFVDIPPSSVIILVLIIALAVSNFVKRVFPNIR